MAALILIRAVALEFTQLDMVFIVGAKLPDTMIPT